MQSLKEPSLGLETTWVQALAWLPTSSLTLDKLPNLHFLILKNKYLMFLEILLYKVILSIKSNDICIYDSDWP